MARIPIIRLNGGEYSPLIGTRSDLAKFSAGCRKCENFIPTIYGEIERRPGTKFITKAKGHTHYVLLEVVDAVLLEAGDHLLVE